MWVVGVGDMAVCRMWWWVGGVCASARLVLCRSVMCDRGLYSLWWLGLSSLRGYRRGSCSTICGRWTWVRSCSLVVIVLVEREMFEVFVISL